MFAAPTAVAAKSAATKAVVTVSASVAYLAVTGAMRWRRWPALSTTTWW